MRSNNIHIFAEYIPHLIQNVLKVFRHVIFSIVLCGFNNSYQIYTQYVTELTDKI